MFKEKYRLTVGIICLVISFLAFVSSLVCMIYYLKSGYSELSSTILLPMLIVNVLVVAIISLTSFISIASKLGKIAFLFNFCSVIFVIVSFICLYR